MKNSTRAGFLAALALPALLGAQLRSERRVVGDTTIVRTLGTQPGSATRKLESVFSFGRFDGAAEYIFGSITGVLLGTGGSLWVFDAQVPALRQYDSTGKYLKTVGRGGQGPGEYGRYVTLTFPHNGNVLLGVNRANDQAIGRDRAANSLYLFDASGRFVANWTVMPSSMGSGNISITSPGLLSDTAGTIYAKAAVGMLPRSPNGPPIPGTILGLVRYNPDGTIRDSLRVPSLGVDAAIMGQASSSIYPLREYWSFSRLGYFVGGRSDKYEIHIVHSSNKVTRIERDIPQVLVSDAERTRLAQGGREVPRLKPYFSSIITDDDGRIWVKLRTASERVPDAEVAAASVGARGRGGAAPQTGPVFREPTLYDVFAPDGRFLGRVNFPEWNYVPAIKGNYVWSATVDSNGVPAVTKFRIVPPLPG